MLKEVRTLSNVRVLDWAWHPVVFSWMIDCLLSNTWSRIPIRSCIPHHFPLQFRHWLNSMYGTSNMRELLLFMWRYYSQILLIPVCFSGLHTVGISAQHTNSLFAYNCCSLITVHSCKWLQESSFGTLEGSFNIFLNAYVDCWNSFKSHTCLTLYSSTTYMQQFTTKYVPFPFPVFTIFLSWKSHRELFIGFSCWSCRMVDLMGIGCTIDEIGRESGSSVTGEPKQQNWSLWSGFTVANRRDWWESQKVFALVSPWFVWERSECRQGVPWPAGLASTVLWSGVSILLYFS